MKPSLGVTHAYRTARGEATLAAARADAAAATVTSMTAAPTSTTTTPAKRFHRNKRGVKVFSNAVPHGAMGKNKATTTTTLDDDSPAASRAAPELAPLHAGAAEFHPAPPQGSYRDAAAPSIETVARGDTPSGPLSNADSSGETSEDGDPTANESAVAGNNARAVDDAQWPSLRQVSCRTAREPVDAAAAADHDDEAEDEAEAEAWRCDECHQRNRPARADCRRCGVPRVTLDESSHSSHSPPPPPPRKTVPPPTPPPGPPPPLTVIRRAMERRDERPQRAQTSALEKQGSLLRTLLPNLPENDDDDDVDGEVGSKEPSTAWADERANDLPTLPPSFANAPDAIAVADDVADDVESPERRRRDFGEGFGETLAKAKAPPPGFLDADADADADAAPVTDASVVALATLQAALAAERAARDAANAARPLVRRVSSTSKPAAADDDASILSRVDAAMDSRLALLERCLCDQLEGLRAEVEAGATERAALQMRLERLEGATFTRPPPEERGEFGGRRETKSPSYSCPPHSRDGFAPASPPLAPRLARGRPPPIVIDVEDDEDDRVGRRDRRELRTTERDDDADDVIEDDATDAPPGHSPDEVIPDDVIEDAAEFEATLAGFRSRPAPLATNPFEGLADEDDEDDEQPSGTLQNPPESPTGDQTPHHHPHADAVAVPPAPPKGGEKGLRRQSAVPAPPDPPRQEETVEEMLAAIAAEEEQRAARRGKKGNRKGNRKGNVGRTSDRQALVDAYLERRKAFAAAPSFGDGFSKLSKRKVRRGGKAVRWADETVPIAAVTGERIRAFVRATTTTALGARLDDVFGGDSFGGARLG